MRESGERLILTSLALSNASRREVCKGSGTNHLISARLPANLSPDPSQIFPKAGKRASCSASNEGLWERLSS